MVVKILVSGAQHPASFVATLPLFAETYERLEADKKRQVQKKRKCVGPTIRYYSGTMPLILDLGFKEENVDVEG